MLHCRDGYFYVGHTDDLERRIGDHQSGLISGFTADHQPAELVWSDEFHTRDAAKAAERKLKGWSRAKKLALIRGDWDRISQLASSKDSTATGSAGSGNGGTGTLESTPPEDAGAACFSLHPHPEALPGRVRAVTAHLWMTDANDVLIEFRVEGADALLLPPPASPERCDGLWQKTCFEMFLLADDGKYFEFNLSPTSQWAIYAFDGYRSGMEALAVDVSPMIEIKQSAEFFMLEADIDLGQIPHAAMKLGLSAVIVEADGTKSYWALAHPPGQPDFHHPACFAATLPAPLRS